MKNTKPKLPAKRVNTRYGYEKNHYFGVDTSITTTASQGDPTNFCTTILTTTHFV